MWLFTQSPIRELGSSVQFIWCEQTLIPFLVSPLCGLNASGMGEEYCDERVCLPACLSVLSARTYQELHAQTHTRLTAICLAGTTRVSRYQKGKTNLDFTEARDSEWQWHQLGHMQVWPTSLQTDNHASTPPLSFLQARCPSCRPTNSVKALKACPDFTEFSVHVTTVVAPSWSDGVAIRLYFRFFVMFVHSGQE